MVYGPAVRWLIRILNLVEFAQGVLKLREFNLWGAFSRNLQRP